MRKNKVCEKEMKTKLFFDKLQYISDTLKIISNQLNDIVEESNIIEEIEKTDEGAGYNDGDIFLLSVEEYEKYRSVIPECHTYWWLRTPGNYSNCVSYVNYNGYVYYSGNFVSFNYLGVRPALKSEIFEEVGKQYSINTFSFTCIDGGLGIATVPISFDKFDDESNGYEKSYIRQWLLNWESDNCK